MYDIIHVVPTSCHCLCVCVCVCVATAEVFEYHIEHASEVISPEEKLTEKKVLSEVRQS